jgi:CO/xanthine dehydrogenase Mo-binding subunit
LDREFQTQSVDPMFLEPEAGIAWYDPGSKRLELAVGSQSAMECTESVAYLLGNARGSFKPAQVHTHCAYVGGGFGGRDHTIFPLYIALAALFYPNRPVRLANNRYEQFQSGSSDTGIRTRSGRSDRGRFAPLPPITAWRRGLTSFSGKVAGERHGAPASTRSPTSTSRGGRPFAQSTAGSMRGYGIVQTLAALEVLIDEAAAALRLDPIEFRRRNALPTGGKTLIGNSLDGTTRTDEILAKLAQHAMWTGRAAEKARAQQQSGILVGTGVACACKTFGTGADAPLSHVEITPEGRISISSNAVEMGTAIGTALANRVAAIIGGVADEVALGQVDAYAPLALVTSGDPYTITQAAQDAASRNPRWVPEINGPSSASCGAFSSTHSAFEAARVVFRFGLWPAALDLWGIAKTDPRARQWDAARWQERKLVMPGLPPLYLAAVAAKAHARGGVTAAMTHGFNRWGWSNASFTVAGETWTADIDALAVRTGTGLPGRRFSGPFVRLDEQDQRAARVNERIGGVSACGRWSASKSSVTGTCASPKRTCRMRATLARSRRQPDAGDLRWPSETMPLYEDGPATANGISATCRWTERRGAAPRKATIERHGRS